MQPLIRAKDIDAYYLIRSYVYMLAAGWAFPISWMFLFTFLPFLHIPLAVLGKNGGSLGFSTKLNSAATIIPPVTVLAIVLYKMKR